MVYISVTLTDGCYNYGLFKSLYSCYDNGVKRFRLAVGESTYECENIKSISTHTHSVEFRSDEIAADKFGSVRFNRISNILEL